MLLAEDPAARLERLLLKFSGGCEFAFGQPRLRKVIQGSQRVRVVLPENAQANIQYALVELRGRRKVPERLQDSGLVCHRATGVRVFLAQDAQARPEGLFLKDPCD